MFSEWVQSFVIIVLMLMFPLMDTYLNTMTDIQSNWTKNRCNPILMPFASYLAPEGNTITTSDNFSYCVQSLMATFAPTILQPFSYLQSMTVDMMESIQTSQAASTEQTYWIKTSVANVISNIYGVFLNVIIEFQIIIIKLLDVQGKLTGMITVILYIMTTVQYTFESMWAGVPGKMIKVLGKK